MSKVKWPEWVWVGLTGRNFCRNASIKGNKRDLLGWLDLCFTSQYMIARIMAGKKVREVSGHSGSLCVLVDDIASFTDQACVWNKAMKELGYTEDYEEKN